MTKTLTFLDMIAAKIMKKYKKIQNMTKHDKTIDIFEYDCSEIINNYEKLFKNYDELSTPFPSPSPHPSPSPPPSPPFPPRGRRQSGAH